MHDPPTIRNEHNLYDSHLERCLSAGAERTEAIETVVRAYVDGKPALSQKKKLSRVRLDAAFWSSAMVKQLSADHWKSEPLVLALTRYLSQEHWSSPESICLVATYAPDTLKCAVRYSGLVLRPNSIRRKELDQFAILDPRLIELCAVLDIFSKAHQERLEALEHAKSSLESLTAFELLLHASLYAFERLVPSSFDASDSRPNSDASIQGAWDAINDLLVWKIQRSNVESLVLTEGKIGTSIRSHLSPALFPDKVNAHPHEELRHAFETALATQIELNEFISRSTDAFSYDDGIRFVREIDGLTIETIDPSLQVARDFESRKLDRLHVYWLNRAIEDYVGSDTAKRQIGSTENADDNRMAYIQAMRTHLRLSEVYGISETVATNTGEQVDLWRAILSLELMSVFFLKDFLVNFRQCLELTSNKRDALTMMSMEGLRSGDNRFPLTWSERDMKVANLVAWTVSPEHPQGSRRLAGAIVDFWTYDLSQLSEKLGRSEAILPPQLFERPVLKFGRYYVQLPWIVGLQNNSTAAINNLRRLGARRGETKRETHQIEIRLGELFESRGFRVVVNWNPLDKTVGEVDLVCARDGYVLVLEVKSTFVRRSQREAWLHAATTLRKAGQQLQRKVAAVRRALTDDPKLVQLLGIENSQCERHFHGWIVDTSIERDHERFNGFLKVSIEEVLLALRDDTHLLNETSGCGAGPDDSTNSKAVGRSLYLTGFTASSFVDVIINGRVWD